MRSIINISLPPEMDEAIEKGMKKSHYSTKSEFMRALVRLWMEGKLADEIKKSRAELRRGKGKLLRSLKDLR